MYYFSIRQDPVYQSEGLLLVASPQLQAATMYEDVLTMERQAKTFTEMIKALPILQEISTKLSISVKDLGRNFDAVPLKDTQLIYMTYTDTSPTEAQSILNTIAEYSSAYISNLYYGNTTNQALGRVVVFQKGSLPEIPISPRLLLNTIVAFVLALVLGVVIAFLRDYFDDTLKTEESVKKYMNDLPVLGAIPVIPKNNKVFMNNGQISLARNSTKDQNAPSLAVLGNPKSAPAEGFRTLRTNIQFLSADHPLRSLVFTSSSPSEGKTTISANIAASIAQMGQRVVLIDADLRRPYVHKLFGLSALPGLSNYLVGKAELQMILKKTSVPNLQVISSGALPPMPAELLASAKMQALLQELKAQFEMVILDVPPAIAVTDASLVGKIADGVIVVIACGKTKREQARATIQTLAKAGITPLGVIMNLVDRRKGYGYYYYYYRSYYNRYEKESEKEEHIF